MNLETKVKIMELFTKKYSVNKDLLPKSILEVECLKVVFSEVFSEHDDRDYFVGRYSQLPVGIGLEWANLGGGDEKQLTRDQQTIINGSSSPEVNSAGPSFHGIISQLERLQETAAEASLIERIGQLIEFWAENDTQISCIDAFKKIYKDNFYGDDINDFNYPILTLTRLSGMELDYRPLLDLGINGLIQKIREEDLDSDNEFLAASIEALELLKKCIVYYINKLGKYDEPDEKITIILNSLNEIKDSAPSTFHSAIQLVFLYSQIAGVVNYGRMDEYLGGYLAKDLERNLITEEDAVDYLSSLWVLIDECCNRGNGRVIIGGEGRTNPENANIFAKCAIKATMATHLPKPQLTLRIDDSITEEIYDLALDSIGNGCTFPMLYNDSINVKGIKKAMNIPFSDARDYTPYGCGEYMIWGRSTASPNACTNFVKIMVLAFNGGIDNYDNKFKGGSFEFIDINEIHIFEEFRKEYYRVLEYYLYAALEFQRFSYRYLANRSSFVFASILTGDCIMRGAPILDGGVKYYSAVNEFYGFSNAIDSLSAIKKVVFEDKEYTLEEVMEAVRCNYVDYEEIQEALLKAPKYGNDDEYVDSLAIELHEHSCRYIRRHARELGLFSYLAVNINNNANTRWGIKTGATFDGRVKGEHLSPGNNPHSGRDKEGITAMLNSISKFSVDIHAGYVQNLKCSPRLFKEERDNLKYLFKTYFKRVGGSQLMITVADQRTLIDAQKQPEKYTNLLVRCGGFSARFVELDKNTQTDIINRTCNE